MSQSERRISLGIGVLLLVVFAVTIWTGYRSGSGGLTALSPASFVGGTAVLVGSLAFLIAGSRERITVAGRTLEWWQIHGAGFVCLGLYLTASAVHRSDGLSTIRIVNLLAGLSVGWFGVHRMRTGPPAEDEDEIEPSIRRVAAILVAVMLLVLLAMAIPLVFN